MSSRPVGIGAFANRSSLTSSYATHGAALRTSQAETLKTQLSVFQSLVHSFALQHGDKIRKDPAFRAEWARMCKAIGVDPLAGSSLLSRTTSSSASSSFSSSSSSATSKGWLAALSLGREVETFYHRIAVRVIEVCRASRAENGGLLAVSECRRAILAMNSTSAPSSSLASSSSSSSAPSSSLTSLASSTSIAEADISEADVIRAVESLAPLGSGYRVVQVGGVRMVRSVPKELNTDQTVVLEALHLLGSVGSGLLVANLGWERARADTALGDLLADSLVWVDLKSNAKRGGTGEPEFWSPAFLAGMKS